MKKIFKYDLDHKSEQGIFMPMDAQILTIDLQDEIFRLWALVDPDESEREERQRVKQPLITKTRKDESTKEERGYLENQALFRVFQISRFRDWIFSLVF